MSARITRALEAVGMMQSIFNDPSIFCGCSTSAFPLESLQKPLHLPPPVPHFSARESKSVHTGIPTTLCAIATNQRSHQLTDALLTIIVTDDKDNEITRSQSRSHPTLDPFSSIAHAMQVLIPITGPILVKAEFAARLDGVPTKANGKHRITAESPLTIRFRTHPSQKTAYQCTVGNDKLKRVVTNLKAEFNGQSRHIARRLTQDESVSSFFGHPERIRTVKFSWDLAAAPNCSQEERVERESGVADAPITLKLSDVPSEIVAMRKFKLKVTVCNASNIELSGEVSLTPGLIVLCGVNALQFTGMAAQGSTDLEGVFIACAHGVVPFPLFSVKITDGPQFACDVSQGLLVVGSEN
jgi:hypothetical protein